METKRTKCRCGKGEFVFYTCQLDGWSYLNNPDVEWYELHIHCKACRRDLRKLDPTDANINGKDVGIVRLAKPEVIPRIPAE